MSPVSDAAQAIAAALRTVSPDLRVYTDPAATVDPPGLMLAPPSLTWSAYRHEPTDATFVVAIVVRPDARAMERLWELVPQVTAVIDEQVDAAAVRRAEPGTWTSNDLPAYLVEIEVALS